MIGRIATWLFYAVFFFCLGVWAAPRLPDVDEMFAGAYNWGYGVIVGIQEWAMGDAPKVAEEKPAEAASVPDEMQAARDAYAAGDTSAAIVAYQEVLLHDPDNLDARGELGNVYFAAGRLEDAAKAYFDVAVALLKKGDVAGAKALEPAIRGGSPELADKLSQMLSEGSHSDAGMPTKLAAGQTMVRVAGY